MPQTSRNEKAKSTKDYIFSTDRVLNFLKKTKQNKTGLLTGSDRAQVTEACRRQVIQQKRRRDGSRSYNGNRDITGLAIQWKP
mmetsp:Transcript_18983/g.32680  ORF Transcript_18983/g.32680 Transcript_18983/m.32680 type:complete len:83 (+) Transcript_18983:221-469(+)